MKALQVPCLRPDVVVDDTAKLVPLVLTEDEFLSTVVDQSWRLFGQLRWQVAGDPWDRQQRRGGAGRPHPHREDQGALPVSGARHAGRIQCWPETGDRARLAGAARARNLRQVYPGGRRSVRL